MFSPDDLLFSVPEHSVLSVAEGGFARQVLAVATREEPVSEGLAFLEKVLSAAGLNVQNDVSLALVEPGTPAALFPFPEDKRPQTVLVFGPQPLELGLRIQAPLYTPFDFYGCTLLFAHSLSDLQPDTGKKGQLWRALQLLFLK